MINDGSSRSFAAFFVVLHTLIFSLSLIALFFKEKQRGARQTLGITFPVARASASVLLFDVACILLPMCRNLVTWLRNTPLGIILPLDKNIAFHKLIGFSIVLFSWVHTIAQYACKAIENR
jgi:NADPH oxidase